MKINVINKSNNPLPEYKTSGSAGMDLMSNEYMVVPDGKIYAVGTGLFVEIPEGYEGQVRTRSGLSLKGIVVKNAPGTIDSDFRGELKVILHNQSGEDIVITPGMRIAQLIIAPIEKCEWNEVDVMGETDRR
jgi:dUTP pyrophosphatase